MNENIDFEISIIIVNYNSGELLYNCILSILKNIDVKYEIIVFDNNSSDNSIENIIDLSNKILIIKNKENLGFAKANNIAATMSKGAFFHFLNPDTIVNRILNDHYKRIIDENKNDIIYCNSIQNENGILFKSKHLIPTIRNYLNYMFNKKNVGYWYTGASLILKRTLFNSINGWPEDYFMYAEDMNLFYNAYVNKVEIKLIDTKIIHISQGCTKTEWSTLQREIIVEKSFKYFYKKYNKRFEYYLIKVLFLCFQLFHSRKQFLLSIKVFYFIHFKKQYESINNR